MNWHGRRLWRSAAALAALILVWFLWLVFADASVRPVFHGPWGPLLATDSAPMPTQPSPPAPAPDR